MNQKKFLIIVACLTSAFLFGEENQKFSLKEINVSNLEKSAENAAKNLHSPLPEDYSEEGDITIESDSEDSTHEKIAYPIDESNFEEVFGGAR
jgi:hypothetical protein